jgi:hypothetical protein
MSDNNSESAGLASAPSALNVLSLAIALGAKANEDGSYSLGAIEDTDLPFFSGCQHCQASLGPMQAYPTRNGYITCKDCLEPSEGFATVEEFKTFEPGG